MKQHYTIPELKEILRYWDLEYLCEVLDIDVEELLDRFEDKVIDRQKYVEGQIMELETPDDDGDDEDPYADDEGLIELDPNNEVEEDD